MHFLPVLAHPNIELSISRVDEISANTLLRSLLSLDSSARVPKY